MLPRATNIVTAILSVHGASKLSRSPLSVGEMIHVETTHPVLSFFCEENSSVCVLRCVNLVTFV